MNFNFDNMNNPNEQPKQDDLNSEEITIINKKIADEAEKDMNEIKDEEEFEDEKNARLEKWDKEENKEQIIEEEKDRIERELGNRIMVENPEFVEQKNIREILKSHDELRNLRNELEEEVKKSIESRREVSKEIQDLINQNADISQLSIDDQMKVETAVSEFLKTTKNVLSVKEIDYLLEIGNNPGDLGDLSKTHEERKIEMEELQEIIKAIEEYKKFMEEFEKLTEEEQERTREEVGKFVKWLEWVKENKKELFLVLVAMGMVAGVAYLAISVGLPSGMSMPAFFTVENTIKASGALVASGTIYYLHKKKKIKATVKAAGIAIGIPIVGGAIILDSILNSEKVDKLMETICGTSIPSWAQSKKNN